MSAPSLVLLNAKVRTLAAGRPAASAIAIEDGTIVAVGDDAEVRELATARTAVVDARGTAIVPGLVDTHIHPFHGTTVTRGMDLTKVRDLDGLRGRISQARREAAPGEWLLGWGLSYDLFGTTGIHAGLVEDVVDGAPLAISFFDDHTMLASRAALRIAGVDGPRRFDEAAAVVCDADGPTGELKERSAMQLVLERVPALTDAELLDAYAATLRRFNALGLAGGHVMLGTPALQDVCRELEARGDLTMRLRLPLWQQPKVTDEEVDAQLPLVSERGELWEGGTAKFFIDGVVESGTGWLHEPDRNGAGRRPFWPDPDRYAAVVRRFAAAGFQCATHAVGDAGVTAALDAYAGSAPPWRGMHRIEHIEVLKSADRDRFASEGVGAAMQPLHMEGIDDPRIDSAWKAALHDQQLTRGFPVADLVAAGAIVGLGSDWPVATPDPRVGMAWCRLRREPGRRDREPFLPEQRIDGLTTLRGYTTAAAALDGTSSERGTIEPGKVADLTGFAVDPVACEADELVDLPVTLTVVDGRIVHRTLQ